MHIQTYQSLQIIPPEQWDSLTSCHFPFMDHAHLLAMEDCLGDRTGWYPFYLCVESDAKTQGKRLIGAAAVYLKTNSYGEFIFDHTWASAYARSGQAYYPKLVCAAPFTPATGEKLLVDPLLSSEEQAHVRNLLQQSMVQLARQTQCSSVHHLFIKPERESEFESSNYLIRHSYQFHWRNKSYASFEVFLETMKSKRRRQIQLERRQFEQICSELNLRTVTVEGDDLTPILAEMMYAFYEDTNLKMGSIVCLTLSFFKKIFESMRESIVLFVTYQGDVPIAAAINFKKGSAMYGRYWGCRQDIRNMHFELCYYRAIEYCINNGIELYEAGAQGEHKIARGFVPTVTLSAHQLFDERFHTAVGRFVEEERKAIAKGFEDFEPHLPFLEVNL